VVAFALVVAASQLVGSADAKTVSSLTFHRKDGSRISFPEPFVLGATAMRST
jgi:hypothetical protein